MTKNLFLYILLGFCLVSPAIQSQEEEIPVQLPQVFPVSPEAASLGKYGDVPVNLATGKINYTVPLYTIKVGDFEWPIYLSYNYSGLLVEEDPGYVGLGWDLMATGRITREIKGIPDEHDSSDFKSTTVVPYLTGAYDDWTYEDYEAKRFEIYNRIANTNGDGQFDNYIISAGSVNGTFKINQNNEAVFFVHKNYVAQKDFVIDEKGIKYYFDEIEMAEYTISYGSDPAPYEVPSSYLLTKIVLPNNEGEIIFEYKPFDSLTDIYYKTIWSDTEISGLENRIVLNETQSTMKTRLLKKIIFPNGQIDFTITPYDQQYGSYTKRSFALNDVTISNLSKQILRYDFTYLNESHSKKMLKEITRSNGGSTESYYKFDYNKELSVSSNINYTAQDYWGYYNGQSAASLIQASREIDTIKTKYGALEKITYPTGGTTSIAYEQNKIYAEESGTTLNCSYTHNASKTFRLDAENPMEYKYLDKVLDVGHSQIVKVVITAAVKKGSTSNALGNEAYISVTANNASENCGFSIINDFSLNADAENCSNYPPGQLCWDDLIMSKEIIGYAEDGILNISGYVMELSGKEAYIEYEVFYENVLLTGGNKNVGGIRVSSTTDCDGTSQCKTTNYEYSLGPVKFGGDRSSGVLLGGTPQFQYTTYHENKPKEGGGTISGGITYRSSNSKASFTSYQGAPVLYQLVTIKEGNGENGYIKNEYTKGSSNVNPGFPFLGSTNYDWQKGKLLTSSVYREYGGAYVLTKKTTNKYSTFYPYGIGLSSSKIVYGMDVGRVTWHYGTGGSYNEGDPNDYKEDYNYYYPKEYKLIGTTVEEFIDNEVNLQTVTDYVYDQPYLNVKDVSKTNSSGDKLISKLYYSYDQGLTSMVNQNRISQLVKSEKYLDENQNGITESTERLESKEYVYKDWGNGIVLPEIIQASKESNSLEPRVRYHSYDTSGNPLEVSNEDGAHIVYLWGYNNQHLIAKIENATSSEVSSHLGILSDVNETDLPAINGLRTSLPNAMITTYEYEPLVGVTKITDSKGSETTYYYDEFNRLEFIRDDQGNLLKEYKYNYQASAN